MVSKGTRSGAGHADGGAGAAVRSSSRPAEEGKEVVVQIACQLFESRADVDDRREWVSISPIVAATRNGSGLVCCGRLESDSLTGIDPSMFMERSEARKLPVIQIMEATVDM
jgi:hypothetical protein